MIAARLRPFYEAQAKDRQVQAVKVGNKTRHSAESPRAMVFMDRDEALLWMEENQIGRRNLSDDQRSVFALSIQGRRSKAAVRTAASIGGKSGGKGRARNSVSDTLAEPLKEQPKTDTRKEVAKEFNLPERKQIPQPRKSQSRDEAGKAADF